MSAQLDRVPRFRPMREADLDRIARIEREIYSHPWTRGNFADSIEAGYGCRVMECGGELIGYGVLMLGVQEAHLLNLSVAAPWQGKGYGRALLMHFIDLARRSEADHLFLEVRPSNGAARRLYADVGFREVSVRRGYYPASPGREDAILMGYAL
ncbi:MAG TPA: ribosomal protein S18-alanine N-acetyltransferase [Burkholderiales bacterium]|jgi:ribosomal-protein-alanine N-acetyltransferase|nr:ribosomal protein S18-alanine N-acetyltransferase [Burkholderiales bacterium]